MHGYIGKTGMNRNKPIKIQPKGKILKLCNIIYIIRRYIIKPKEKRL